VGFAVAYAVMMGMAFALTVLLAELSYRFVERPAMALKSRIRYGGVKKRQVSTLEAQPMLAQTE
jgi:peptidoglycan/LPS O-acetylase OafA/YrhL